VVERQLIRSSASHLSVAYGPQETGERLQIRAWALLPNNEHVPFGRFDPTIQQVDRRKPAAHWIGRAAEPARQPELLGCLAALRGTEERVCLYHILYRIRQ